MKELIIFLIKLYKSTISKALFFYFGPGCKYRPTCSEYAVASIEKYGVVRGGILSIKRLSTCHSF